MNAYIQRVLDETRAKNANEPEFLQTVEEVLTSLEPVINAHPEYEAACLLERMVEPERTIEFRVVWMDDQLKYHVNRGYRVQYNAALGPYKGGLRFASNVNLSIIKFLGFEQTFKDALTCLPIGGAKGGSDFSPIGRSDGEVMRFCQAFMTEFHRHIGQDIDCPAGDVGVGGREVGYLYGQYRRIVGAAEFGAMSGKVNMEWAKKIAESGVPYYIEVGNMPTTNDALAFLMSQKHLTVAPSKAVNACGVSVSELEMAQNAQRIYWSAEEVDAKMESIMKNIYDASVEAAERYGLGYNLVAGANIAGFQKVADAMMAQGIF